MRNPTADPSTRRPGSLRGATTALAAAAALGGCVVGPDYQAPTPAVPAAFSSGSASAGQVDLARWWRSFDDPTLDSLIARALVANLDVRQSAIRIEEARLQARIAGAAGQPTISAESQASYTKLSKNSSIGAIAGLAGGLGGAGGQGGAQPGLPGTTFETYQVGFDASWELDVFGGVKRSKEAAGARTSAAEWSLRDAQVMLAAELARSYLQYRALERRIAILDETLAVRVDALDYDRVRQRNGLVTSLDVRRAERDIASQTAARQDLAAQRDAQAHALALLLGQAPSTLAAELAAAHAPDPAPAAIPAGLPSDLLRRRPDIRAAERRLAAATADIGVATADLYPKISLTGATNLVSASLGSLLAADSFQPAAAIALKLPLLDGGRSRATVRLRKAQAQEAAVAYQAAVLAALRDVEDALSRLQADRDRERQLQLSEAAARDALDTAQVQQRAGLTTGLDVLEARGTLLGAQDSLAQVHAAAGQDAVALYKALGGGWDDRRAASGQEN